MKNNMKQEDKKIRVLSGIRASHESIHLGVYFGAMKGMIKLQNDPKYETFYMVADLHGITTDFKSKELKENRLGIAMDYLASGIDPNKSVLFFQSDVHEHAELAFYLWKRGNYGDSLPFWEEENDESYRQHLFLYKWDDGVKPLWHSSNLPYINVETKLKDVDEDGENELVVKERSYDGFKEYNAIWKWDNWGFTNLSRSD